MPDYTPDATTGRHLRGFFLTVLEKQHLTDWHRAQDEGEEAMRAFLRDFRVRVEEDGEVVETTLAEQAQELLVTGTLVQIEQAVRMVTGSDHANVILAVFPPYV